MNKYGKESLEKNKNIKELSYFFSRIYNFHFFPKKKLLFCFFFIREGDKMFTSQTFENIWKIEFLSVSKKKNNNEYIILTTKKIAPKPKKKAFNFIEIWEYSEKNKLKRKSRLCFNGNEIWDIGWNQLIQRNIKKNFGTIALCCGFSLKIIEIPNFLPSRLEIFSFSINIDLINIFQWKMCWKNSEIVTGDIGGKIISYNLGRKLYIKQIINYAHKNLPIGSLKIFFSKGPVGKKFLVTGGFDGYVKLWNLKDSFMNLFQINFFSSKILSLDFSFENFGNLGIFIGLDNGFFSTVFLKNDFLTSIQFNHTSNLLGIKIKKNLIFTLGEDGELSILEINTPFLPERVSLNLLSSHNLLFHLKFKFKNKNSGLQNLKKKFFSKNLNGKFVPPNNYIVSSGGNSGIIVFHRFFLKNNYKKN
ncbi:hypothetical protein CMESO_288 (nucleomorph) [Chroomonas mesostigmatica CCMP1168]|uniref:Uncharacterized protein n=1 Tax=Chroomonas mesostigmatica CCMP1168 TaxID=1195612 RepID=J7G841_9CRYP|nr:hypothetical protein CMESO_288 [Chroomonas mesostigmatica CCMP1168]